MIDGGFKILEHNNDPDDLKAKLQCYKCNHEFTAEFNVVRRRHVEHVFGESVTVTCPSCGVKAATKHNETKLNVLLQQKAELEKVIEERGKSSKIKFEIVNMPEDPFQCRELEIKCNNCNTSFMFSHDADGINNSCKKRNEDGSFSFTCVNCQYTDIITQERWMLAVSMLQIVAQLCDVEKEIKELTKQESNNDTPV